MSHHNSPSSRRFSPSSSPTTPAPGRSPLQSSIEFLNHYPVPPAHLSSPHSRPFILRSPPIYSPPQNYGALEVATTVSPSSSAAAQQPVRLSSAPTGSPTVAVATEHLRASHDSPTSSLAQLGEVRITLIELLKPLLPADAHPSPTAYNPPSPKGHQSWLVLFDQPSPDTTLLKQKLHSDRISRPLLDKIVDLILLLTQLVQTDPSTTFSTDQVLWKRIETVCVRAMALCKSQRLAHSDIEAIMAAVDRLNNLTPNLDAQRWGDFSRADDELVGQIQRLSRWRMEDQRAEMPPLVAQGVAAMGWLTRPAPRDPEMEAFMDQLERAGNRRMLSQCADPSLSALMVAYRASMVESEAAERAVVRLNAGRMAQQDASFTRPTSSVPSMCSEAEALHSDEEDEHTGLLTGPIFRRHRSPSAVLASKWNMFAKLVGGPEVGRRASVDPSTGWGRSKPRVGLDDRRASEAWTGENLAVA